MFSSEFVQFRLTGQAFLVNATESVLTGMIREANIAYCNTTTPIITDSQYDILRDYVTQRYNIDPPTSAVSEICKVTLPCYLGGMNKIKPDTGQLHVFQTAFPPPYVTSHKLDGISGLYCVSWRDPPTLYTKGDARIGQDISHVLDAWRLPTKSGSGTSTKFKVRGECIMRKSIFQSKYAGRFANARCLVSGALRDQKKGSQDTLKDIDFVAYEVIEPAGMSFTNQWNWLIRHGFTCVPHTTPSTVLTNASLSNHLQVARKESVWDIDGIIISHDAVHAMPIDANPTYSTAFKMVLDDQLAEAKVLQVHWTASKDGYLKPRVEYEPVILAGTTCQFASGFNGAYIRDQKIGVGAIVQIVRSGDVIPHIHSVLEPASVPQMPSEAYRWTDTQVDCILAGVPTDHIAVRKRLAVRFFKEIETKEMGPGNIARCFASGFDSIPKILRMTIADFEGVDGFKMQMADKLYDNIRQALRNATMVQFMVASNLFGRGFSHAKLSAILEAVPDICENMPDVGRLANIQGMSATSAHAFINGLPPFIAFMKEIGVGVAINNSNPVALPATSHQSQINVVLTGARHAGIKEYLAARPYIKVQAQISKTTMYLITSDSEAKSSKLAAAQAYGTTICTPDEFLSKQL